MNKSLIIENILHKLQEKLSRYDQMIGELRASNNDQKSSMGDKYETTRERLQQEINTLTNSRNQIANDIDFVKNLSPNPKKVVGDGALVKTNKSLYFMATSIGIIDVEGEKIIVLSKESPLGKVMKDKQKGDLFQFNGAQDEIIEVY